MPEDPEMTLELVSTPSNHLIGSSVSCYQVILKMVHWWEHPLSTLYLRRTRSHPAMPTVLSIVLSLFGLFLLQLILDLRRVARDVGFVYL